MAKYNELAYASAVTRVRAIQNRQLDKIAAEKMITAKTESEAIQVLTDLGWAGADDYETMLKQEMSRTISLVEELGGGSVLDFRVKYDFHNLKVLIKSQLLGTDEDDMLIRYGNYKVDTLRQALLDRDYRALAPKVAEAIESAFDHYARLKIRR